MPETRGFGEKQNAQRSLPVRHARPFPGLPGKGRLRVNLPRQLLTGNYDKCREGNAPQHKRPEFIPFPIKKGSRVVFPLWGT